MDEESQQDGLDTQDEIDLETGDDGDIYVAQDRKKSRSEDGFYENIAESLTAEERKAIAFKYIELIRNDITDRSERDRKLADSLKRTGFGKEAPGGADFEGASRVTHPLIGEATIDFAARERKELLPPNGPVKTFIQGKVSDKRVDKANRKAAFMNKQLVFQSRSFLTEVGKMLSQLPLGGSEYMKAWWDEGRGTPEFEYIPIENFFMPSACSGFITAHRKTIRQKVTENTFKKRVSSGLYFLEDGELLAPSDTANLSPEGDDVEIVKDQIQGITPDAENQDGLRTTFESYIEDDLSEYDDKCDESAPYILHLDVENEDLLGLYRNWKEDDDTYQAIDHVVDFGFIKWEGPYDLGLPHLIGGIAVSLTGGLRALLDSALIQNSPTSLRLSSMRISGQSIPITIGQINNIDAGAAIDDIRKVIMPLPLNGPSPVLMQLISILHDLGKGVVRTAMDDTPTENPETPVGTQLSRVEQALVVYSDIHSGLHQSMTRLLNIVHRLNSDYLPDEITDEETGEILAKREDFEGQIDIMPISDPRVFSELQRYQQAQFTLQLAQQYPQFFNLKKLIKITLAVGNIRFADEVFIDDPDPSKETPVAENLKMMRGDPVNPMMDDDHLMHIKTTQSFMASPFWGMNSLIAPTYLPLALDNVSKRLVYWQVQRMNALAAQAAQRDQVDLAATQDLAASGEQQMATVGSAVIAQQVSQEVQQIFADLLPIMQAAQKLIKDLQPQEPAVQVAMAEVQRQTQRDQGAAQARVQEIQVEAKKADDLIASQQMKTQEQRQASEDRIAMNEEDNATAMALAAMEIEAGQKANKPRLPGQ